MPVQCLHSIIILGVAGRQEAEYGKGRGERLPIAHAALAGTVASRGVSKEPKPVGRNRAGYS
jgi:hypothetical protein